MLLVILPVIASMIGLFITFLLLISICLITIGITGIIMNKLYIVQTKSNNGMFKRSGNITSIILGFIIILFPICYFMYEIISIYLK